MKRLLIIVALLSIVASIGCAADPLYIQQGNAPYLTVGTLSATAINAGSATITNLNAPTATLGSIVSPSLQEDNLGNVGTTLWDYGGTTYLAASSVAADPVGAIGFITSTGNNEVANYKVTSFAGTVLYSNNFTADALNSLPAGWAQWDTGGVSNFQVKVDATHPSGRVVQQQTAGAFDGVCYLTGYTPPATNKYIITMDFKAHLAGGWWIGATLYQSAPGTFKYSSFFNDNWVNFANYGSPNLTARISDVTAAQDVWYSLKVIVDGQREWTFVKTMAEADYHLWLNWNWGKTVTVLETPGAFNRNPYGIVKQLWFTRDHDQNMTINIYYDGSAVPTISLPIKAFFNGSPYGAEIATRYWGQNYVGKSFYRYIDIPYTAGIKIEIVNDTNTGSLIWWHVGYLNINPIGLGKYTRLYAAYDSAAVAPLAWEAFATITGEGAIYSVYMGMTNATNFNYLEGDIRILQDGSNTPVMEASGTEDFPLYAFYFYGAMPRCTDDVGAWLQNTAGVCRVGFYRFFIRDPLTFQTSLIFKWQAGQELEATPTGNTTIETCVLYYLTA